MATRTKLIDGVTVTASGAGAFAIPTTTLGEYNTDYDSPIIVYIFVAGSGGNAYVQPSGSVRTADGRYIVAGGTGKIGPVSFSDLPQLYFDAAGSAEVSFDILASEG